MYELSNPEGDKNSKNGQAQIQYQNTFDPFDRTSYLENAMLGEDGGDEAGSPFNFSIANIMQFRDPNRIDFLVELGASLLCLAAERGDPETRAEGIAWLERATELPERWPGDATDRERARAMLDDPARACGNSRVGFLRDG